MKRSLLTMIVVLLFVVLAGCSKAETMTTPKPVATDAPALVATEVPAQPAAGQPTDAPTEAPVVAPTEAPAAVVAITHLVTPGEPVYKTDQKVSDCSTGDRVRLGATTLIGEGCDIWDEQNLERPAAAINGPYQPAIDITGAWMGTNQQWLFGKLVLFETDAAKLPSDLSAGFEIDTDLDSRGEYLIIAKNISSTDWTTDGVQVWQDKDGLVGGGKPHQPDTSSGNGYETLVFDAGVGDDADLAWVRLNNSKGIAIEFAFKPSFVPANQVFAWWGWTSLGAGLNPAGMEVVDLQQNTATWNLDNTCAWIFNAKPTNLLINICPFAYPTAVPTATPASEAGAQCPPGEIWRCVPLGVGGSQYCTCYDPNGN